MNAEEIESAIVGYTTHLERVCEVFNEQAAARGVGVRLDAEKVIASIEASAGLTRVREFALRLDDDGVVHEEQLRTFVDCLAQMLNTPYACGHVLGAMQSGKTTTSLALQWAGPAVYQLRGERPHPFYIISNQTTHEDQTNRELQRFLTYYDGLEIVPVGTPSADGVDALFARAPSLQLYRQHVLRDAMEDIHSVSPLEGLVHRRVGGRTAITQIAELCRRATDQGYRPLMIIDEPQFGAGDRMMVEDGVLVRKPCVLQQMFEAIEEEVGAERADHWFIGLSATPFELNDLSRIWEVRQYLSPRYTGFNCFNQAPIDGETDVEPPETLGLSAFADHVGIPEVANISMAAYGGSAANFTRFASKIDFDGDQDAYRALVEETMASAIVATLAGYADDPVSPVGLCIRAFNNNERTEALIGRLGLDPDTVEIIRYFGPEIVGQSIKRVIATRARPDLPYVIFVTNRARMADAFPPAVRFFWDMAQKASDLNALLQGLLGRACGYDKASTVVLSDANANIVDAYSATGGGYVFKTSRNSVQVGGYRRGAPTTMIKLLDTMEDDVVREFFARVNAEIVAPNLPAGSTRMRVPRASNGSRFRTGPVLNIAGELGLFDHIESSAVRARIFPQIPGGFGVVRAGEVVRHRGDELGYQLDGEGGCRYTFRWSSRGASAQGGAAGRARGSRDVGQHLEPTIYVEKYNPGTQAVIGREGGDIPGSFRAFMVTFPLRDAVRELEAAEVAYPTELSPYDSWTTTEERAAREAELAT